MWADSRRRASVILASTLLLASFLASVVLLPGTATGTTRDVGGGGPGNYTSIQAAIDDANPGDTVFVYAGTYQETVTIDKTLTLVGENRDTTIIKDFTSWTLISVQADWVNITGFSVVGELSLPDAHGIDLWHSRNCTISNNSFLRNWHGLSLHYSSNTMIANNTFVENMYGLQLSFSDDNRIYDNRIWSNHGTGTYIHASANVTISRNNISSNGGGLYMDDTTYDIIKANTFHGDGIYLRGRSVSHFNTHMITTDNTVNGRPIHYYRDCRGLNVDGTQLGQLIIANCTDVNVSNLHIYGTDVGIELGYVSGATISGNNVSTNGQGIGLWFSERTTIADNDLWGNGGGIIQYYSRDITLRENRIFTNSTIYCGCGIHPFRSTNVSIISNTISGCADGVYIQNSQNLSVSMNEFFSGGEGVRMWVSANVTISGNDFSEYRTGIRSFHSANITITRNNILSSEYAGIRFQDGDDVAITGNNIAGSERGIALEYSSKVLIHHNNLINNTLQAYDDLGAENSWDNGYPSGGNYWSDYEGVDNCSGPNQDNCPDPDGIGDTPYEIDVNSSDRYPLMSPVVTIPASPPTALRATLSGGNSENIHLTWTLSSDDGMGQKSVIGYDVYRGTSYDPNGSDYELTASLPNGISEFMDLGAGEGDSSNYFYRVCAVDSLSSTICASNQAGKFTRPLTEGKNLISIPLVQSDENIGSVLQTVKWNRAWFYDSSSQEWNSSSNGNAIYGNLLHLNHMMGLWVSVIQDSNLTVAGVVPAQSTIQLYQGWNLVSFPSMNTSFNVTDMKASLPVERVEGFDPAPPHFLRVLGDTEVLQAGQGYWVKVEADTIWTVSFG